MDLATSLEQTLGLRKPEYRHNLDKTALFKAALANDRGRIRPHGPDDEPKAWATRLGADGPLLYYSDPSCTGRPVKDTFAVAWPEVEDEVWWKDNYKPFDPAQYQPLLERVVAHLNQRAGTLFVQDVYCGRDPTFAVPYRFVGEYASHALFAQNMFVSNVDGVAQEDARR